jgi:hypothetical protein
MVIWQDESIVLKEANAKLQGLRIMCLSLTSCGPGSAVGIATALRAGQFGDRIWVEARFTALVQIGPGTQSTSYTMDTGSFPGVKSGRGVTLTPHPLLVAWSRKGRAISLLPLRAVRPLQNFSACTSVHLFTVHVSPLVIVMITSHGELEE